MDDLKWYLGLGVAVLNDLNDIMEFERTPIEEKTLNNLTSVALWPLIGEKKTLGTFVENIPRADVLPVHTMMLLWSWKDEQQNSHMREIPVR